MTLFAGKILVLHISSSSINTLCLVSNNRLHFSIHSKHPHFIKWVFILFVILKFSNLQLYFNGFRLFHLSELFLILSCLILSIVLRCLLRILCPSSWIAFVYYHHYSNSWLTLTACCSFLLSCQSSCCAVIWSNPMVFVKMF